MRNYYRAYQNQEPQLLWRGGAWEQPAQTQPIRRESRKPSGRAVVLFVLSLVMIAALTVILVVLSVHTEGTYAADEWEYYATGETTIEQAPLGDGTVLTLVPSAGKPTMSFQDIYSKNIQSIVSVVVSGEYSGGLGTGVIMSENGYIVTNAHVVVGSAQASVSFYDGTTLEAALVGYDEYSDLAVLKVDAAGLTPAEFGDSSALQVGDVALALGNPLGTELWGTMTDGIISAINRDVEVSGINMSLIQTTAALNSGNSGGALINDKGQVIGITNMKLMSSQSTIEGLGFAIPSATAKTVADALIAQGSYQGPPVIGIRASSDGETSGVMVYSVDERSSAYERGLRPGDLIIAVDGVAVNSVDEINAAKGERVAGDTLHFTVSRNGKTFELTIELVDSYSLNN